MADKKTLDLTEFLAEDAEVKWSGGVLKIPSDLPFDLMVKTSKYKDMDGIDEEGLNSIKDLVSDILKTRNETAAVDKFIKCVSWQGFMKVVRFMFEFINAVSQDEEQVKKKTD